MAVPLTNSPNRVRRRLAVLVAVLLGALAMVFAAPAMAGSDAIGCGVLAPGHYCLAAYAHHEYETIADYPGAGSVYVCASAIRDSNSSVYADACATNHVVVTYSSSVLTKGEVQNASSYAHTVNGRVYF